MENHKTKYRDDGKLLKSIGEMEEFLTKHNLPDDTYIPTHIFFSLIGKPQYLHIYTIIRQKCRAYQTYIKNDTILAILEGSVSLSTIDRAIKYLEDNGYLKREFDNLNKRKITLLDPFLKSGVKPTLRETKHEVLSYLEHFVDKEKGQFNIAEETKEGIKIPAIVENILDDEDNIVARDIYVLVGGNLSILSDGAGSFEFEAIYNSGKKFNAKKLDKKQYSKLMNFINKDNFETIFSKQIVELKTKG